MHTFQHTVRRARERGQSTVEYVGLAVAVAVLLVAVGGGLGSHGDKLGGAVAKRLQEAVGASK
ncbi:MAG: hypothetical protein JWO69_958 [Thermoleophilia bacterium]|jgi:Flp pilus assembly pilin Flp|nr:hypothetical protein [Thermoleophilia bacterium]